MNVFQQWFARHRPWRTTKPLGSCGDAETWLKKTAQQEYEHNRELEDARERQRRLQDELTLVMRNNKHV